MTNKQCVVVVVVIVVHFSVRTIIAAVNLVVAIGHLIRRLETLYVDHILQYFVIGILIAVPELVQLLAGATPVAYAELYGAGQLFLSERRRAVAIAIAICHRVILGVAGDRTVHSLGQLKLEAKRVELLVTRLVGYIGGRAVENGRRRVCRRAKRAWNCIVVVGHELSLKVLVGLPVIERAAHEHLLVKVEVLHFDGAIDLAPIEQHVLEWHVVLLDFRAKLDVVACRLVEVERVEGDRARHLAYVVRVVGGAYAVVVIACQVVRRKVEAICVGVYERGERVVACGTEFSIEKVLYNFGR